MEKMLVTQALNELKTLDSRIMRAINNATFVTSAKICEKNVTSNMSKEDFNTNAKSNLQSIDDLINRRKNIKAAIVASNAVTMVTVAGVEMTVAAAIERKTSIEYEKSLLKQMKNQYVSAKQRVDMKNAEMESAIERLVATAFGKDSKTNIKSDDYSAIADPYKEKNEWALVDPVDVLNQITKREEEIDAFLSEIDSCLQISNCTNTIEF